MKEAAFTVTFDGKILFCNAQFGQLVKRPLELVVGHPLHEFVSESSRAAAASLLIAASSSPSGSGWSSETSTARRSRHTFRECPEQPDGLSICVVASDLTELENSTN